MVNREKYMGTEDFKRSIEIIKNFINTYLNKARLSLDKEKLIIKNMLKFLLYLFSLRPNWARKFVAYALLDGMILF